MSAKSIVAGIAKAEAGPLILVASGAFLLLYVLPKVIRGVFTNQNPLTNHQTDAQGNPVTAYSDTTVPVVGTLGAAANSLSGGTLASIGEWFGGLAAKVAGLDSYDPNSPATASNRTQVVTPNYVNDIDQLGGTWQ